MRSMRARRDRRFQCETLEDRSLLSAIPGTTAEVHPLKTKLVTEAVRGTLNGTFTDYYPVVTLLASGNLPIFGRAEMSGSYQTHVNFKTLKSTDTGGMASIADYHGDGLILRFTGTGKESASGLLVHSYKGTIIGGSLEFAGATGTFTASSTASPTLKTFQMTVDLKIKLRR